MPNPYQSLASSIDYRTRQILRASQRGLEPVLGEITATGLKIDGFAHVLRDYGVAVDLTLEDTLGTDSAGDTLPTPAPLRSLRPGDRVVVLPVNQGRDHIVIARVAYAQSSTE